MKNKIFLCALSLLLCFPVMTYAQTARAYLDSQNNVHLIAMDGKDVQLSKNRDAARPMVSSDNTTVAWFIAPKEQDDGSSQVTVYRDGHLNTIECEPFIRGFWFWKHGTRIAIDCGGIHFAGTETLYDTTTMKKISSFDQAVTPTQSRPEWSDSSPKFKGD
jgi:hypothetical protein